MCIGWVETISPVLVKLAGKISHLHLEKQRKKWISSNYFILVGKAQELEGQTSVFS